MTAQILTFDPETHTYRSGGKVLPSVTQVLESEGISDFSAVPAETLALAKARGTAVHIGTELLDCGTLDWSTVDDSIAGYLSAWERFKDECRVSILAIEERVQSSTGYAGTMDRVAKMRGRCGQIETGQLEIKTGPKTRSWRIQTAAYQYAHRDRDNFTLRTVVQLNADGSYQLHPFTTDYMHDLNVFMAALTLYDYKRRNQ